MNTLKTDVLDNLVAEYERSRTAYDAFKQAVVAMPKELADTIFYDDYTLRLLGQPTVRNAEHRLDCAIDHAAWKQFIDAHDAYHICDGYGSLKLGDLPLMYGDVKNRDINGAGDLAPFSREAAVYVWEILLHVDNAKIKRTLSLFLDRCGASYQTHPTKFATRMTLRSLPSSSVVTTEFVRAMYAICLVMGVQDFTFGSVYNELRLHHSGDETPFYPVDDIELTVEYQKSCNATLRLSKEVVTSLNAFLGV